ncbi:MAG: hypothetical protein H8E44_44575 [Planctomycetes bacterium]|nr:hypothetical protein [Planctomycetota bacterium]
MKHKFTTLTAIAVLTAGTRIALAQQAESPTVEPPAGQDLVSRATRQLWQQPSLEARLRQKIDLFGQQLVGTGHYLQKQSGDRQLLRLELKVQLGEQLSSMQQVCDGRFLWIRRELPGGATLGRVDLNRIRTAIEQKGREPLSDSTTNWIALGGLPRLLAGLDENFQFGPARPAQLGKRPVWITEGHWKRERLSELLPDQKEAIEAGRSADLTRLSPHLPGSVQVVLGQRDLIPYRIEYRRPTSGATADGSTESTERATPAVALELFDVRRRDDLQDHHFVYQPGNQPIADHTDLYLQNMGLLAKKQKDG